LVEVWLTSRGLPRCAVAEQSGDIEIAFVQARQRGPHYLRWRKEINLKSILELLGGIAHRSAELVERLCGFFRKWIR